jgi:feruloyl esterase
MLRLTAIALLMCAASQASAQSISVSCEALARLDLPELKWLTAESVDAGMLTVANAAGQQAITDDVPAFCRVRGVIEPAISFEVWLPAPDDWNGRFQAVGGGFAGIITYRALVPAIQTGYATASTDTGRVASDARWLNDQQQLNDYGYRAIHQMTVKAKTIIDAYYGKAPDNAYFNG